MTGAPLTWFYINYSLFLSSYYPSPPQKNVLPILLIPLNISAPSRYLSKMGVDNSVFVQQVGTHLKREIPR